eukprot:TRINITY_DN57540_c0_g1_i1.p1 TRINITY_DN57540_c0_g1~~TRINITY_DN57540_c0_g1_i1.p1  ORF type:complete len:152 (-),score=28.53 TRINITY_DN57540_c0_g1_i1:47-502(-)
MADEATPMDTAAPADTPVEETKVDAPEEPMDAETALKHVLRTSLFHDSLARGLRECVKALDRREAHLCVLSSSFTDEAEAIPKLIQALCSEHNIPMIKVPDSKKLGEWVGLCKYNQEGKAVKVVSCSCAVVKNWGEESDARHIIMEHLKTQ